MSRALFVAPPFMGHLNPAASVAVELQKRGHDIGWITDAEKLSKTAPSLRVLCAEKLVGLVECASERPKNLRGPAAVKFFWETCFDIARAMHPIVRHNIESFRPDVILSDQQAISGAFGAREAGLPWLTLASTAGELSSSQYDHPGFHRWLSAMLTELGRELSLSNTQDPRFSPFGTVLFSSESLTGPIPAHLNILAVGCSVKHRNESAPFPWQLLDDRRKILVSLGTVNTLAGREFLGAIWSACNERRRSIQTILVDPSSHLEQKSTGDIVLVKEVPQLSILKHMDAVVSHGGQNTVSESLLHGLPMVVAPIRDDQPVIANQVVDAGAGIRVRFGRPNISSIGAAIDAALEDPQYRQCAEAIRPSMADGTDRAADAIEHFLETGALHGVEN